MHEDEVALVERLRQGDRAAFDRVYARYADRVYAFLLRLSRDPALADDLAQDTWVAFARAAGALRPGSDLAAFLFTVARNQARSHRRWSLLDLLRLVVPSSELLDPSPGPEQRLDATRAAHDLERAIVALAPHHQEPLLLVCVEGFEPERAAAILGVSAVTLRKRLSRARAALAEELARSERGAVPARRGA